MMHIIDANNLAGKLDLLDRDDFDIILINLIKEYSQTKKFVLVFDSADPMGDKKTDGNVTVIYTPRDNYYKNADDKIIEIARKYSGIKTEPSSGYPELGSSNAIRVITDDIEIKQKIEKINLDENLDIELEQASDFAKRLEKYFGKQEQDEEIDNKEGISDDEVNDINKELLDIWKE